ncbi:hypothetical protein [Virgibacillus halodenitrificans]|uniref:hypothetical protein n=1 Tax=Virgibacillus halodenitrificans TaxID=1482 RepID=UPI002DBA74F4|nr:hypothetical protein [Virgibacillus halodenitrificans]MEC2159722.1 hypothetical protein [Virgibacillus halodenitrificans]
MVKKRKSIQEMEKELGLDKVKSITVTSSVAEGFAADDRVTQELKVKPLEKEMAELYEQIVYAGM